MKRRYILLLSALVLFTGAVIMTGCPSQVKPQTPKYKVTLNSGKHGSVTVKPTLPADGMVEAHTRLSFTAQPDEGYELDTWTGANRNYPDNTTATLTVMADTAVSVTFKRIGYSSEKQKYKVTLVQPEHGTVTVKPALSEDGMIPQYTRLTFTVTPEPGWQVNKWTGAGIWQDKIGYDVENNEVHLSVTEDVIVSVTMIEEGKVDASLLKIDSTGRLTGVTDKYRLKGSLAIPNTVTAIGSEALADCTGLTSVIIPDSVTSIGYNAFYRCTGLTGVTIGNNVTEIDAGAFYGCHNLISITIPDSVIIIGSDSHSFFSGGAFHDCKSLTSVTIGKGVTKIDSSVFSGCGKIKTLNINCKTVPYLGMTSLKELTLGDNVNEIGKRAFDGYSDLTNVTIPNSVTKIGNEAFQGCTGLTSMTIGSGVTKISDSTFSSCTGLTGITIPNAITEIGEKAFSGCTGLTDVIIPDSVTDLGDSAFENCSSITSLTIGKGLTTIHKDPYKTPFDGCNKIEKLNINCKIVPRLNITSLKEVIIGDNVTIINGSSFSNYNGLTSITIGNNVTTIGYNAFSGCTSLTSITIPNAITEIGEKAFSGCTKLATVNIGNNVTMIGNNAFSGCIGLTSITIPDSVTKIGSEAFQGCTGLTSVTIPDSVTKIGYAAFASCTGLTDVTIPDSITEIGSGAFQGCTGLTDVIIPDSVTEIGDSAFKNCSNITSLTIGKGLTTTNYYFYNTPFDGCNKIEKLNINCKAVPHLNITSLKEVIIGDNVNTISKDAFSKCTDLTNVTIGNNITTISDNAFSGCTSLTDVIIPDSVAEIGKSAFKNCSSITSLTIGKGLTTILLEDDYPYKKTPFDGCNKIAKLNINCKTVTKELNIKSLKDVIIGDNVTKIDDGAFFGCASLANVTIGNRVVSIGNSSFESCTSLTSLTIGDNVTKIGEDAFAYCSNLADISIPNSVTEISKYAFRYCSSLTNAKFKNTMGWKVRNGSFQMNIEPTNLQNHSTAAKYLISMYVDCRWTKN